MSSNDIPIISQEPAHDNGILISDIKLVMDQTNVSYERAINALIKNNGDIVNAIMEITM